MKEDIISKKLRRELSDLPIDTEARVIYLLVEIRKVLDHDNIKTGIVRFYTNWVVHTDLSNGFANKIFKEVSDENSDFGHHIKSFKLLQYELRKFFVEHDLPVGLTDEHWLIFRDKLLDILIDTPILNDEGNKSFGFYKSGDLGGVQYYIKDGENFHTLGRVWV